MEIVAPMVKTPMSDQPAKAQWLEESKPVSCLAHYQQSSEAEKIAQSIILNGIRCQIQ